MAKTNKITYKVFLFERVKKKLRFFETETYPLQIRLTSGARSVYLKSNLFTQVLQNKYQQDAVYNATKISVNDVISCEEDLIGFILNRERNDLSLEAVRKEYALLSKDILDELDERFKKFLVGFFYEENLPAYSLFIKNDGGNHTSEFILENLEKSLQTTVFEKLLKTAVVKAPPYIPFVKFFREAANYQLPLFPVYRWQQDPVLHNFNEFIDSHFPEYKTANPAEVHQRVYIGISGHGRCLTIAVNLTHCLQDKEMVVVYYAFTCHAGYIPWIYNKVIMHICTSLQLI